ncbi:MAG: type II secretion system F family protein [Limisphaerales bacterium]
MSFIVTPRQFFQRAEFYHQLAQLTSAGIGLLQALEQLRRNPPGGSYREPIQQLLNELGQGRTFAASLNQLDDWLPEFDIALIDAGERSGRLDACFRLLADYYNDRARITKQVLTQLIYPVGLVHFAALVFLVILPFARSQFNLALLPLFLVEAALALAPLYLAAAFIIYATNSRQGEKWRSLVEAILSWIPIIGKALHQLAIARLAVSLEALISAGVNIVQAWSLAANASGSLAVRRAVTAMEPEVIAGLTPAEAMQKHSVFPNLFTNLYASGEVSGKLDETLRRLYTHYQEEGTNRLYLFAQWMPRLIYGLVAGLIAYNVIKFWMGYFNQISTITGGF